MTAYPVKLQAKTARVVLWVSMLCFPYHAACDNITLDLSLPDALDAVGRTVQITVNDPVYHAIKRYEGYPLLAVLKQAKGFSTAIDPLSEVVFHCADGYRPTVPFSRVVKGSGFLAIRDLDAGSEQWKPFMSRGTLITPKPYYVVWQGVAPDDSRYPWPYQMDRIEIVPFDSAYRNALPGADPEAAEGFEVFRAHCMKCHSVNLAGGSVGGELNVPMSVVDYWQPLALPKFIASPAAVGATSKMPNSGLSLRDIDKVLAYLKDMRSHKICNTTDSCQRIANQAEHVK